jgi:hypothetical protein
MHKRNQWKCKLNCSGGSGTNIHCGRIPLSELETPEGQHISRILRENWRKTIEEESEIMEET